MGCEIMNKFLEKKIGNFNSTFKITDKINKKIFVIPPKRVRYLSEISENNREYDKWVYKQKEIAQKLYALQQSLEILDNSSKDVVVESNYSLSFILEWFIENPKQAQWPNQ